MEKIVCSAYEQTIFCRSSILILLGPSLGIFCFCCFSYNLLSLINMMSAQGKKGFLALCWWCHISQQLTLDYFYWQLIFFKVLPEMYNCIMLCICLRFCCPSMAGKKPCTVPLVFRNHDNYRKHFVLLTSNRTNKSTQAPVRQVIYFFIA